MFFFSFFHLLSLTLNVKYHPFDPLTHVDFEMHKKCTRIDCSRCPNGTHSLFDLQINAWNALFSKNRFRFLFHCRLRSLIGCKIYTNPITHDTSGNIKQELINSNHVCHS